MDIIEGVRMDNCFKSGELGPVLALDVGCLRSLLPLNPHLKHPAPPLSGLYLLSLGRAVVAEHMRPILPAQKSVAFGVVEPLHFACVLSHLPSVSFLGTILPVASLRRRGRSVSAGAHSRGQALWDMPLHSPAFRQAAALEPHLAETRRCNLPSPGSIESQLRPR